MNYYQLHKKWNLLIESNSLPQWAKELASVYHNMDSQYWDESLHLYDIKLPTIFEFFKGHLVAWSPYNEDDGIVFLTNDGDFINQDYESVTMITDYAKLILIESPRKLRLWHPDYQKIEEMLADFEVTSLRDISIETNKSGIWHFVLMRENGKIVRGIRLASLDVEILDPDQIALLNKRL